MILLDQIATVRRSLRKMGAEIANWNEALDDAVVGDSDGMDGERYRRLQGLVSELAGPIKAPAVADLPALHAAIERLADRMTVLEMERELPRAAPAPPALERTFALARLEEVLRVCERHGLSPRIVYGLDEDEALRVHIAHQELLLVAHPESVRVVEGHGGLRYAHLEAHVDGLQMFATALIDTLAESECLELEALAGMYSEPASPAAPETLPPEFEAPSTPVDEALVSVIEQAAALHADQPPQAAESQTVDPNEVTWCADETCFRTVGLPGAYCDQHQPPVILTPPPLVVSVDMARLPDPDLDLMPPVDSAVPGDAVGNGPEDDGIPW